MTSPSPGRSALITGAAGFVGSTLTHHLLAEGWQLVGLDNLERGHASSLPLGVPLVRGDVRDTEAVHEALRRFERPPELCIHLASLILVEESVAEPEWYHDVNTVGTQVVVEACMDIGVEGVVLASSTAVLGVEQENPEALDEDATIGPESPYGLSKLEAERTLDAAAQTGRISGASLRLFNVAGAAHGCAELHDPESHLIPLALQAVRGDRDHLAIFGQDFDTPDGTCTRDYVHVLDVCEAFLRAGQRCLQRHRSGEVEHEIFHVGTGRGHSVLDVVRMCAEVVGRPVPTVNADRRAGDVPSLVCCPARLKMLLGLEPSMGLHAMVSDCAAMMDLLPDR